MQGLTGWVRAIYRRKLPKLILAYLQDLNFVKIVEAMWLVSIEGYGQASACLNIGAGDSYHTLLFSRRYTLTVNLDTDFERLACSKVWLSGRRGNMDVAYLCAAAECLPFRPSIDTDIVAMSAIEHFANQNRALSEFAWTMKIGSCLFLTTDSLSGAPVSIRRAHSSKFHVRNNYDVNSIASLAVQLGLDSLREDYFVNNSVCKALFDFGIRTNFGIAYSLAVPLMVPATIFLDTATGAKNGYFFRAVFRKSYSLHNLHA